MKNVMVIFGGESVEHDISILTALQVLANLNKFKYNIFPVYVNRKNKFYITKQDVKLEDFKEPKFNECILNTGENALYLKKKNKLKKLAEIDVALLAFHGGFGENGTSIKLLELCGIPAANGGFTAHYISMDKILTKSTLAQLGLNYAKFQVINSPNDKLTLEFPVVVKPAKLGSSIGVALVKNYEEYNKALELAMQYDDKALAEEDLSECIELNCAAVKVLENNELKIIISDIEEPVKKEEVLTFESKYKAGGKKTVKSGMAGLTRKFPADIPELIKEEITETTKKIYESLEFFGPARIDFFHNKTTGKVYVNEINAIPGSLAFYLFKNLFDFPSLLDKVIETGLYLENNKKSKIKAFDAQIF